MAHRQSDAYINYQNTFLFTFNICKSNMSFGITVCHTNCCRDALLNFDGAEHSGRV